MEPLKVIAAKIEQPAHQVDRASYTIDFIEIITLHYLFVIFNS